MFPGCLIGPQVVTVFENILLRSLIFITLTGTLRNSAGIFKFFSCLSSSLFGTPGSLDVRRRSGHNRLSEILWIQFVSLLPAAERKNEEEGSRNSIGRRKDSRKASKKKNVKNFKKASKKPSLKRLRNLKKSSLSWVPGRKPEKNPPSSHLEWIFAQKAKFWSFCLHLVAVCVWFQDHAIEPLVSACYRVLTTHWVACLPSAQRKLEIPCSWAFSGCEKVWQTDTKLWRFGTKRRWEQKQRTKQQFPGNSHPHWNTQKPQKWSFFEGVSTTSLDSQTQKLSVDRFCKYELTLKIIDFCWARRLFLNHFWWELNTVDHFSSSWSSLFFGC